jgi:hypothetical protein
MLESRASAGAAEIMRVATAATIAFVRMGISPCLKFSWCHKTAKSIDLETTSADAATPASTPAPITPPARRRSGPGRNAASLDSLHEINLNTCLALSEIVFPTRSREITDSQHRAQTRA